MKAGLFVPCFIIPLLAASAYAEPPGKTEKKRCNIRYEWRGGVGAWGFGAGWPDDDVEGLSYDLGLHVAPSCGRWIIGGRAAAHVKLQLNLFGTKDDRPTEGLLELAPTTGIALRGDGIALIATAGPAVTRIRPTRSEQTTTLGLAADVAISIPVTSTIGVGAQLSTNINTSRSLSSIVLRFERVISR